ncbi:MAG: DNA-formamidopyrimidine glycosylase family protein, partial [Candidatus Paceibacteria bacterium]
MPELPEVQTIVDDLNKTVKGLKITGFWTDWKRLIKEPKYEFFEKQIKGREILGARRRAKYI